MTPAANRKMIAGVMAAAFFVLSLSVQAPFLHSYLHGHSHSHEQVSETHDDGHADHARHPSKPCDACDSCRPQNHFSLHLSPALDFQIRFQPLNGERLLFLQDRPVFFLPGPLHGRAPPVLPL